MTDDEEVQATRNLIAHWRARNEAFFDAVDKITVDGVNGAVKPKFDRNGHLIDLDIDPDAMGDYTNNELEEILLTVIRKSRQEYYAKLMEQFNRFLSHGIPGFEPDAAGEAYVPMLSDDPYSEPVEATRQGV